MAFFARQSQLTIFYGSDCKHDKQISFGVTIQLSTTIRSISAHVCSTKIWTKTEKPVFCTPKSVGRGPKLQQQRGEITLVKPNLVSAIEIGAPCHSSYNDCRGLSCIPWPLPETRTKSTMPSFRDKASAKIATCFSSTKRDAFPTGPSG